MSRAQGDVPHQTTDAPHPTETGEETHHVVDLRKPEFRDQPTSEQGDGPHTGERGDGRAVDEQPLGEQAEGALKNNLHSIISYADFILRRLAVDHPMRQDRPMISHLETAREQATWLIERFTYVPGSVSRSEIHEHMQQIQSASRIILPEIAYGKQPAQLETWKGIHLCRLEILQVLQHHDPKDRPPHEVSELRQPPEDAPRTLIEKHLSYMQEQLPGLQRDIHWITPDYSTSTPQQMHRHMARCQESVGRLSTMLEGGASRQELLREALRMGTGMDRLKEISWGANIHGDIRAIASTVEGSYQSMLWALRRGEAQGARFERGYNDTAREIREGTVLGIYDGTSTAWRIEKAASALHEIAERARGEHPMEWSMMQRLYQRAGGVFERLQAEPDSKEKAGLRAQFEMAENRLLDTLLERSTAHPQAEGLLQSIDGADDGRARWQAIEKAIEQLDPKAYDVYTSLFSREERERLHHGEKLSEQRWDAIRAEWKDRTLDKPLHYVFMLPDISRRANEPEPIPEEKRRADTLESLFKIHGAILDHKRETDYPGDMDCPQARLDKQIALQELVLKLGEHRPPDEYSQQAQAHRQLSRQAMHEALMGGEVASLQDLNERRMQALPRLWEEHGEGNISVLGEAAHIEGARALRFNVEEKMKLAMNSPEFKKMVDECNGEMIFGIYAEAKESGDTSPDRYVFALLPRYIEGEQITHTMIHYKLVYAGEVTLSKTEPVEYWKAQEPDEIKGKIERQDGRISWEVLRDLLTNVPSFKRLGDAMTANQLLNIYGKLPAPPEEVFASESFVQNSPPLTGDANRRTGHFRVSEGGMDRPFEEGSEVTPRDLALLMGLWIRLMDDTRPGPDKRQTRPHA